MASTGFTEAKRSEYLQHIRAGVRRGAAAELLDLTRFEVLGYIADHPEFEMWVRDAEAEATEHVEEAVYQAAVSGNVQAAKMWLERTEGKKRRSHPEPQSGGSQDAELDELFRDLE